jgi:hypothetical protein
MELWDGDPEGRQPVVRLQGGYGAIPSPRRIPEMEDIPAAILATIIIYGFIFFLGWIVGPYLGIY